MRKFYTDICCDGNGRIISGATVTVFLAGTNTLANIYSTLAGTTPVVGSVVTTGSDGSYSFFVDGFDYDYAKQYKLSIVKTGYTSFVKDDISIDNIVLGTYAISSNKTVSVHVRVPKGVLYQVASGKTLSFTGPFEAGDYQVFDTASLGGTVLLPGSSVSKAAWWGQDVTAIGAAWAAIDQGEVHLSQGVTYGGGNLLIDDSMSDLKKKLVGNGAIITGNVTANNIRSSEMEGFECNGYMEVSGAWSGKFRDIDIKEAGAPYSPAATGYSNHYLLVTSSPTSSNVGSYWDRFENIRCYGIIVAPTAHGDTYGCNALAFNSCQSDGALSNSAGDYTDTLGAGLRIVGDTKAQAIVCRDCDFSRNTYGVLNESDYPVTVMGASYLEVNTYQKSGQVIILPGTYVADSNTSIDVDVDGMHTSANQFRTGGILLPAIETADPYFTYLDSSGLPRSISGGTSSAATFTMEVDATGGNPYGTVVKAVAPGGGGTKSVRFYGRTQATSGHLSVFAMIKGQFKGSAINGNGGTPVLYNVLRGYQDPSLVSNPNEYLGSTTDYTPFYGSGPATDNTESSWGEIILDEGQTIYISMFCIAAGNAMVPAPGFYPKYQIAVSDNVIPSDGYWVKGTLVVNTPITVDDTDLEGSWSSLLCTKTGTGGGTAIFAALGQIGYRSNAGNPSGALLPKGWPTHAERAFDSVGKKWYTAVGAGNTDWA